MTNFVRVNNSEYGRPDCSLADYTKIDPLLVSLLSLCTPSGQEQHIVNLVRNFLITNTIQFTKTIIDKTKGNLIIQLGESATMFSCHMDIVGICNPNNIEKGLVDSIYLMSPDTASKEQWGIIYGAKKYLIEDKPKLLPSTLGADDKVGVFILLKMLQAGIPGTYVFHTGEESGGIGSAYLATHHKELFTGIERAIAFDRAGYGDVIGFQRGKRCCSTIFGEALALRLNAFMPPKQQFKADITGTFTDTANYVGVIPECTNVSVGYFNQHGTTEHLDFYWLQSILLPTVLKLNYESLPTKRDPKEPEYSYSNSTWNKHQNAVAVEWAEATANTPLVKFPRWTPNLSYMPEIDPTIIKLGMERFIARIYGEERRDFVEQLYFQYEYVDILEDEIAALKEQVKKLKTKQKTGKPSTVGSPEILLKKEFLGRLIGFVNVLLKEQVQQPYKDWLVGYSKGAKDWLTKNAMRNNLDNYETKEITKLNRLIYALSWVVDMVTDGLDEKIDKLMTRIGEYIDEHPKEDGFKLPLAMVEEFNKDHAPKPETVH